MQSVYLAPLIHISIKDSLATGIRVNEKLYVTNDSVVIRTLLSSSLRESIGPMESDFIRDAAAILFAKENVDRQLSDEEIGHKDLGKYLLYSQLFLMSLWFIKDNSVNLENGFIEDFSKLLGESKIYSNRRLVQFSMADGETRVCEFNSSELRTARAFMKKLFDPEEYDFESGDDDFGIHADSNRILRAFYFAQGARTTANLGLKIANYVTCFESLFANDSAELSHKLAERIALITGNDANEQESIFRKMKKAYALRSKVVHGDKPTNKHVQDCNELSLFCDALLRRSFQKISEDSELKRVLLADKEEIEDYMIKLLFCR